MSKEAMELALEALENMTKIRDCQREEGYPQSDADKRMQTAITALREALAEQPALNCERTECGGSNGCIGHCWKKRKHPMQQELVAVVSGYYGGQCVILPLDPARIFNSNTALYTTPPPCPTCEALARTVMLDQTSHDTLRKPTDEMVVAAARVLSDRQAAACNVDCGDMWKLHGNDFIEDARAALESAHGIREKNT